MRATARLAIWWHRKRTGHHTRTTVVTVALLPGVRPIVVCWCDCGRTWAE